MKEYIQKACGQITDKAAKKQVAAELESHISDKIGYYRELGYDDNASMAKALEDMGNPEDISASLNALHKSRSIACVVLTVILLLLYAGVHFYHGRMNYGAQYELLVYHSIVMDFLSLGFVLVSSALLLISFRKKKKLYALIVTAVLIVSLIHSFAEYSEYNNSVLYAFQPLAYAPAKIVTNGFHGYINSIFAYNSVQNGIAEVYYHVTAAIVFIFLTAWSSIQFIVLRRMELMKSARKTAKLIRIASSAFSSLLAVNTVIMIICTVAAAIDLPKNLEAGKAERAALIDDVIEADLDNSPPENWEYQFKKIENAKIPEEYYYLSANQDFFMDIYGDINYSGNYSNSLITYKRTDNRVFLGFRLRNSDNWASAGNLDNDLSFDDYALTQTELTLSDFKKSGLYRKAVSVMHYRYTNSDIGTEEHIQFWFLTKSEPIQYTFLKNSDGEFYLEDYYLMFRDEFEAEAQ